MSKRIVKCQIWEWYGDEDYKEGRYKAKGGMEFVFEATPESDSLSEDELIAKWNNAHNCDGRLFRYEAKSIDYYWEPALAKFVNGKFII